MKTNIDYNNKYNIKGEINMKSYDINMTKNAKLVAPWTEYANQVETMFKEDNYMNKAVSKEEFEKFISEYSNKLEIDYYMDWYSYNDFSLNGGCVWPESMVAMKSDGSYDQPIEYKILLEEYWKNKDIEN